VQCDTAVQQGAFNRPQIFLAIALAQRGYRAARPHWQPRLRRRPIGCWGCCRASARLSATAVLTPGLHGNLLQLFQACSRRLGRRASVWRAAGWQRLTATGGSTPAAPPQAQPTASMLPRPSIPNPAPLMFKLSAMRLQSSTASCIASHPAPATAQAVRSLRC